MLVGQGSRAKLGSQSRHNMKFLIDEIFKFEPSICFMSALLGIKEHDCTLQSQVKIFKPQDPVVISVVPFTQLANRLPGQTQQATGLNSSKRQSRANATASESSEGEEIEEYVPEVSPCMHPGECNWSNPFLKMNGGCECLEKKRDCTSACACANFCYKRQ